MALASVRSSLYFWSETGKERSLETWNLEKLKNKYQRNARFYDLTEVSSIGRLRAEAVERLALRPGESVLDLGCGTGLSFSFIERKIGPRGRIVGVDLSPDMLARARQRMARRGWSDVSLIESNAEEVDLPPNSFDAVLCFYSPDVMNSPDALERAAGALRLGGRFVATGSKRVGGTGGILTDWITRASLWPFVTDHSLKSCPWNHLEHILGPLEVESRLRGAGYLVRGVKGLGDPA